MRAKEYLEVNKSSIKHFDEVNEIVNQMMPLRHSKDMTDNYFNNVLSADIRRQNYLLQKDLFEKNNAMQPSEPIYNSLDESLKKTKPGLAIKTKLAEMKAPASVGAVPSASAPVGDAK